MNHNMSRQEFYLSKSEFNRISDHLSRPQILRDNIKKEIDKCNEKRELSKDMVKNWSKTIDRIISEKHEAFLKERQVKDDERNRLYYESQKQFAEEQRLFIENARRSLFLSEGLPLELTNAMKLGQVEQERKRQIELTDEIKKRDNLDNVYAERLKKAAQDEINEKREATKKRREDAIENRKYCYQQYLDRKSIEQTKKEELIKTEADDNVANVKEMEIIEEYERKKVDKYKRSIKKSYDEFNALQMARKEKLRIEDEQQDEALKVYNKAKLRMECIRKEKEAYKIAENFRIGEELGKENEARRLATEEIENANIKKAEKELDERRERQVLEELKKTTKYKEEAQKYREQKQIDKDAIRKKEENILKWELLNRNKQDEVINEMIQNEKEARLKRALDYKNDLLEQMEELNVKIKREKEADANAAKSGSNKYNEIDEKFFDYAKEVIELCDANGWNKYAVNKVIDRYIEINNLNHMKKKSRCDQKNKKEVTQD